MTAHQPGLPQKQQPLRCHVQSCLLSAARSSNLEEFGQRGSLERLSAYDHGRNNVKPLRSMGGMRTLAAGFDVG